MVKCDVILNIKFVTEEIMRILTGSYNHSIDDKNRIRIPAKLKNDLFADAPDKDEKKFSLVFHTGTDGCIAIYTQEAVDRIFASFAEVKQSDFEKYKAVRKFLNTFETVESDPQGRLVVPPMFKKHAKIKKDLVICGTVDHIEIWSKEVYNEYFGVGEMNISDINELVKTLGL